MSEGSMMGSGIYSESVSLPVECECGNDWEQDFNTDDWGSVEEMVKCPNCGNKFNFSHEAEESDGEDPDRLHDEMGEE